MLCTGCEHIFYAVQTSPPGSWRGEAPFLFDFPEHPHAWAGAHHIEPGAFSSSVTERCYICSTVFRDCSAKLRQLAPLFRSFYCIRVLAADSRGEAPGDQYELEFTIEILQEKASDPGCQVFDCSGIFKILPKKDISVSVERLELTSNTLSKKCEGQVRQWLSRCVEKHDCCGQDWRTKDSYPARLLKVGSNQGENFQMELFDRPPPPYVTLSHCWSAGLTVKLTKSTLQSLIQGIAISELPLRFRDAVAITRWMKIDYVWIDALCILQDSDEDWLEQSTIMGDIYANSYCNIAATSGDPERGCFTDRLTEMVEPYVISDPRTNDTEGSYVVGYDDFWSNSLLDTELHKRAWVLQERLLSPRAIHFGQEQIFWECRCEKACEAYPEGIPEQLRNWRMSSWRQSDEMLKQAETPLKAHSALLRYISSSFSRLLPKQRPRPGFPPPASVYEIWSKTVERYMECKLTFSKDKLVAISGIAQRVARATNERYLAGLWDNSLLVPSLLWYVVARKQADGIPSIRAPSLGVAGYRAPSWSWASLDAKMKWNWPAKIEQTLIAITETAVIAPNPNDMSTVSSAKMHLKGQLFEADLMVMTEREDGSYEEDGRYAVRLIRSSSHKSEDGSSIPKPSIMEPVIYLDVPLLPNTISTACYLLPVCTGWQGRSGIMNTALAGLLLKKVNYPTGETLYERIGIFGLDESQASSLYATSWETFASAGRLHDDTNRTCLTII